MLLFPSAYAKILIPVTRVEEEFQGWEGVGTAGNDKVTVSAFALLAGPPSLAYVPTKVGAGGLVALDVNP